MKYYEKIEWWFKGVFNIIGNSHGLFLSVELSNSIKCIYYMYVYNTGNVIMHMCGWIDRL